MNYKLRGADAKEYGPVTAAQVKAWVAEGRVNSQTLVQAEGAADWRPLASFPELTELSGAMPPLVPPPEAESAGEAWSAEAVLARDYELNIGNCVTRAWTVLWGNFGVVVGGVALFLLIQFAMGVTKIIPLVGLMIGLANLIITGPFVAGLYGFLLKVIRGQFADVSDIFAGFRFCFLQAMLAQLVMSVLSLATMIPGGVFILMAILKSNGPQPVDGVSLALMVVGFCVALVPFIYIATCWVFTIPLVMDRQMEFWSAMETSRKMVARRWLSVFVLLIVNALLNVIGFLACCVGLFVAIPLALLSLMYAYEDIFGHGSSRAD